ncbi:hypothetical protein Bca52824_089165 [Brassica carinata]|uniref:Uncharacterized protein n=1 Tax=Brassica carinata TaxID=52824 RepID=A0A8X7PF53_BRACI|nr:hypothetical protein Bca52824_089165 [Brassica carinata]
MSPSNLILDKKSPLIQGTINANRNSAIINIRISFLLAVVEKDLMVVVRRLKAWRNREDIDFVVEVEIRKKTESRERGREAEKFFLLGLKYAQMEPEKRPTMSEVVEMLMNKLIEKMSSEIEANSLFKNPYSSN